MTNDQILAKLRSDARVESVYHDSDGWWMNPRPGFRNAFDDPRGGDGCLHGAHEMRLSSLLPRMRGLAPCDCKDCKAGV